MAKQLFTNNASAALASDIADTDLTLTVGTGLGALFPTITGSNFYTINVSSVDGTTMEVMTVTARTGDAMTVTRAQEGTVAADFSAGAIVRLPITASAMQFVMDCVYAAAIAAIQALTPAADKIAYFTSGTAAALTTLTSFARTLLDDTDAETARATLGLTIGTNVQAYDAELAALAGLTSAADKVPYFTGSGTAGLLDLATLKQETLVVAVGDETTVITTGPAKITFRMPWAMTLTDVRASLTTESSSGNPTVDINESGTTILSTKLSIDSGERTSTTATTPAVISDASLADDAEITIDIDTAGTGAAGLKVYLIGTRA